MCRKTKLFSEQKKSCEISSTIRLSKSKGKDKWEEEFLLIKSVTGKYLHLEEKLRLERQCLAANIIFPLKCFSHPLCTKHSPGSRLCLEHRLNNSFFLFSPVYIYHLKMKSKSISSSCLSVKTYFSIYCSSLSSSCIVLKTPIRDRSPYFTQELTSVAEAYSIIAGETHGLTSRIIYPLLHSSS